MSFESTSSNIVHSRHWLRKKIEQLLESGQEQQAKRYLEKLLATEEDARERAFCHHELGFLASREGDIDHARLHFEEARRVTPRDPVLAYGLGNCEAASARWWRALLRFFEAIHFGECHHELAEFMRAAAVALWQLGYRIQAQAMLLGALERAPDDVQVLDTLSRLYEEMGMLVEALEVREALVTVLEQNDASVPQLSSDTERVHLNTSQRELDADLKLLLEKTHYLRRRMREQIELVDESSERQFAFEVEMTRLKYPSGLHTLVNRLQQHARARTLLEMAQILWARAHHDRYDVHLTPFTLAGAIHAIVERLAWVPSTPLDELAGVYGVDSERIRAAVRLLVSGYRTEFIPEADAAYKLPVEECQRLMLLQRAILCGVDVAQLERGPTMLI